MALLQHGPRVRFLPAMTFAAYPDVPSALQDTGFPVPPPEETAMMVFNGTAVFELNLVSAFVWDLLRVPCTTTALVETVTTVFGVDRATAQQDIVRLCETFLRQNLLAPVG
jgi:hypothetical protein